MSQLGTKQDSSKLQENLQQLQHSANCLAKETNEYLKELGSLPLPLSASEQRQQRLQKERLMNDFSAALNNFQAIQRRVSEKEKETVARARAGSRISADERFREEQLVSFDSGEDWNQMQSQEDDVAITEQDLELIKERETAIRQLEADILDVNQIFKDLAMMIHDQGDMIDSIEANVESAEVHVERASEQLQRAAYYQKKSRKKICNLLDWNKNDIQRGHNNDLHYLNSAVSKVSSICPMVFISLQVAVVLNSIEERCHGRSERQGEVCMDDSWNHCVLSNWSVWP
uniref:Protein phosphatase 1 regulatory subunit 8 n=1 Tax=Anser cygnoides TaxID=8845 RepID=A0A8B9D678_ANSCY